MLENAAFLIALVCILVIVAFVARGHLIAGAPRFFPPPEDEGWQKPTFRWLFRGFFYGLAILTAVLMATQGIRSGWLLFIFGATLCTIGFAAALHATGLMGWNNAFGARDGLRTDGWFAYSRNPVYVASWLGMAGWAIAIPELRVWVLLALWALLYLIAPLVEEPWLQERYGDQYRDYRKRVRRFL